MGADSTGIIGVIRRQPYLLVLGILMVISAAVLFHYRAGLNFMLDDWAFVVYREDGNVSDFLDPHNEHISVIPVAIFKLFLSVFGMSSPLPLQIFSVVMFLICVLVVFFYLKPLVGEPLALAGCAVLLFLGAAWEDLLWIFQLGFSISLASGVGALIMLRRQDRRGDRLACLLLLISVLSTSLGIPFLVGATVDLLLRRERFWRRIWLVAVPAAVFGLWWLGWGHNTSNGLSVDNAINSPKYVFEAFRLSAGVLTGAFQIDGSRGVYLMRLLGVAVILVVGIWLYRQRRLPRPFLVAAAVALAFWGLAALNQIPGRDFGASRYQLPGAMFLLMILAGAIDGRRIKPYFVYALGVVAALAIVANLQAMSSGYRYFMKPLSDKGIAGLTALDIVRHGDDPAVLVGINADDSAKIDSGSYFRAVDKYGSPAWDQGEIDRASEEARARIDLTLLIDLSIRGEQGAASVAGRPCMAVRASLAEPKTIVVPGNAFAVRPRQDVAILMERFADEGTRSLLAAKAGRTTAIHVPGDNSDRKWRIGFEGRGRVLVCSAAGLSSP